MFKTNALSSFKSIFPPIHHPAPITERESQRLLNALKTSFRQQLDREHGFDVDKPFTSKPTPAVKYISPNPSSGILLPPNASPQLQQKPFSRPTDRHLHAILDNPLFRQGKASELQQSSLESRKAVFQNAVSKGLMTTKRAFGFLLAVRKDILASSHASLREGMAASGAALLVVQWLRASGLERSLQFIEDTKFTTLLINYMVAEGLDGLAWTWMERLAAREVAQLEPVSVPETESDTNLYLSRILSQFVLAKSFAFELDGAYDSIFKAKNLFDDHSVPYNTLNLAWRLLAWQMTGESYRHGKLSEDQFDSFVDLHRQLDVTSIYPAHLDLHHPTKPSSDLALEYLGNEAAWKQTLTNSFKVWSKTDMPPFIKKFTSITLDTVQNLTNQGQYDKADWALDIVRNHLSPLNLANRGVATP